MCVDNYPHFVSCVFHVCRQLITGDRCVCVGIYLQVHICWACMHACHAYGQHNHMFSHIKQMHVQLCQICSCTFSHAKQMHVGLYEHDS